HRLGVRAGRVPPDYRLLQEDGDRAGAQHRPEGARARGTLRAGGRPVPSGRRASGPGAFDAPAITLEVAPRHSRVPVLLDSYIYGFALTKMNLPFETTEEVAEVAQTMLAPFQADANPEPRGVHY